MGSWGLLKKEFFIGLFSMAVFFVIVFFVYDLLFSHPTIHRGIIVEKLFVPAKNIAGPNSMMGSSRYRTYKYAVSTKNNNQWVAFVRDEAGDILKVNCKSDHYESKAIGDTLLFKEFRGEIFKVEYFSHNDEDMDSLDLKVNRVR